jgi:hypothetical protein
MVLSFYALQAEDGAGLPGEVLEQPNFEAAAKIYFTFIRLDFLWDLNLAALLLLNFFEVSLARYLRYVSTTVGLVLSSLDTIQVSIMRIWQFLIPKGYEYLTVFLFLIPFGSIYHARFFIPGQNYPSIIVV